MKTGLTQRTVESLQLNAGVLLSDYTKGQNIKESDILGATRGGGTFSAVQTIRQMAVDGAPVYTKGLERVDEWVVTLTVTMLEFNKTALERAFGAGATVEVDDNGNTKITGNNKVISDNYKDIFWVGDMSNGKDIVIKIKNALNTNGFTMTINDKGEGTYPLNLIGHYDISDLKDGTAPFDITVEGGTEE